MNRARAFLTTLFSHRLQRALRPRPQGAKGHRSQGSSSGGLRGQLFCGAVGDPAKAPVGHLRHFRRLSGVWERIRRPGRALDGSQFPTFEASRPPGARAGCRRSSPPAFSMAALFPGCAVAREGYPAQQSRRPALRGPEPAGPEGVFADVSLATPDPAPVMPLCHP